MEAISKRQPAHQIGDDIYLHIFSLISTADLCRCRCVCRDWRRLLPGKHNLAFALIVQAGVWFPRFYTFSGAFLRHNTPPSFDAALTPPGRLKSQTLVACNGMVLACIGYPPYTSRRRSCLRIGRPDDRLTVDEITDYVLLNPVTAKASTIPPPPCGPDNSLFNFLVFDPSSSFDHFMLISLYFLRTPEPYLYSSRTGEWRRLDAGRISAPPQFTEPGRDDCHCIDNFAYKIAGCSSSSTNASEYQLWVNIMAFNVMNECLFWVNSPVLTKNTMCPGYHYIGDSAGRLAFAYLDHFKCLSIWALNDCHTGDWSFKHKINLNDVPLLKGSLSVFAFHPVHGDLVFVSISDHLLLANLRTLEVRELFQGEEFPAGSLFPYLYPITSSLV